MNTLIPAGAPQAPSAVLQHPLYEVPLILAPASQPMVHIALPDGRQARLPGALWPTQSSPDTPLTLGGRSPIAITQVSRRAANSLYEAWRHPLGAYRRPFGEQHFVLAVNGRPAAAVSSASIQSRTVAGGLARREVVELARIARAPQHPHALRALLRPGREYLTPCWAERYWPVHAAIAYALPGKTGGMYRFDSWTRHGTCRPWAGGATWSAPSRTNAIADGIKTLWIYRYPTANEERGDGQLTLGGTR